MHQRRLRRTSAGLRLCPRARPLLSYTPSKADAVFESNHTANLCHTANSLLAASWHDTLPSEWALLTNASEMRVTRAEGRKATEAAR